MSLKRQRAARAVHPQHVRIVLLVRRVDERNHLRLVAEGLRKQRTNRPVDLPAGQDLFLARPSLALDEAAGNASARIGVLAVLHRQREEVDALLRVGRGHGRGQNYVVSAGGERGAGGLLGHPSGLKFNPLAAGKLYCHFLLHSAPLLSFFCQLRKLGAAPLNNARRVAARQWPSLRPPAELHGKICGSESLAHGTVATRPGTSPSQPATCALTASPHHQQLRRQRPMRLRVKLTAVVGRVLPSSMMGVVPVESTCECQAS